MLENGNRLLPVQSNIQDRIEFVEANLVVVNGIDHQSGVEKV